MKSKIILLVMLFVLVLGVYVSSELNEDIDVDLVELNGETAWYYGDLQSKITVDDVLDIRMLVDADSFAEGLRIYLTVRGTDISEKIGPVDFDEHTITEFISSLDVSNLNEGSYMLEIVFMDSDGNYCKLKIPFLIGNDDDDNGDNGDDDNGDDDNGDDDNGDDDNGDDDNGDDNGKGKSKVLKLARVVILDEMVEAGGSTAVLVNVENAGRKGLDDIEVLISIPDLGIRRGFEVDDLDPGEEMTSIVPIDIPDYADGIYSVRISATNDDARRVLYREIIVS